MSNRVQAALFHAEFEEIARRLAGESTRPGIHPARRRELLYELSTIRKRMDSLELEYELSPTSTA